MKPGYSSKKRILSMCAGAFKTVGFAVVDLLAVLGLQVAGTKNMAHAGFSGLRHGEVVVCHENWIEVVEQEVFLGLGCI